MRSGTLQPPLPSGNYNPRLLQDAARVPLGLLEREGEREKERERKRERERERERDRERRKREPSGRAMLK